MCDCYSNVAEAFTIKSMSTAKVFYLQNSDIPGALSPEILDKFRRLQSDQIKWQKSRIESIIQVRQKSAAQFSILRPSKTVKTRTEILAQASMSKSARMEPSKAIAHDAGGSPGDGKLGSTGVRRLAGRTTPLPSLSSYTASRTPKSVASVGGRRGGGTGRRGRRMAALAPPRPRRPLPAFDSPPASGTRSRPEPRAPSPRPPPGPPRPPRRPAASSSIQPSTSPRTSGKRRVTRPRFNRRLRFCGRMRSRTQRIERCPSGTRLRSPSTGGGWRSTSTWEPRTSPGEAMAA